MSIHPLASVSPHAKVGPGVQIGPYCLIEPDVVIGPDCVLESHVVIKRGTVLGPNNRVFEGVILGGLPQHIHIPETPGGVVIGSGNIIRENVTVHRALKADQATIIGDNNLLMVGAHVAHDCCIGSHCIITNNVLLAGHVAVADRAYLSGAVAVHQFCRIGSLAMVGGQAHITKDVPPFVTVDGLSSYVVGLNQVGLRRAGFRQEVVATLKAAYRVIYRSGLPWREILEQLQRDYQGTAAAAFHEFLAGTKRGVVSERRMPPGATIRLRRGTESETPTETELRVKFG
ncbi:MAG: acyl-ACP--UDP-N-acetylglucosamine O-acyltransferase [Planctomycetota bacterium]